MATLLDRGDGRRAIQFDNGEGRKTVGLGICPKRDAEKIQDKIEALLACRLSQRSMEPELAEWVGNLDRVDPRLAKKLVKFGLIEARQPERSESSGLNAGEFKLTATMPFVQFVDHYIAKRTDAKPATIIVFKRCLNLLREHFNAKPLNELTKADAKDFFRWMTTEKKKPLSQNTARRMMGFARQFMNDAAERDLIVKNPFLARDIRVTVKGNPDKFYFVSREDADKVLASCPDAQWRLIFALSRFGGLRCPSEHLALKWADVDWSHNRIRVTSPKTEHHEGHEERVIPLFPELRTSLEEAFDPENEFVITKYRSSNGNLRTQLNRIVVRAGLTPWTKPFHNLRATRQTELSDQFPDHVVCNWLGNSEKVARKHYLHATDEHFIKASSANGAAPALQSTAAEPRTASHDAGARNEKPLIRREIPQIRGLSKPTGWTTQDSNL